ncbi:MULTISPECIES: hypothetical protein [Xanthomonas]|uniref:Type IV secretion protein DotF n=3 Tax=Xanthomonas TaxID=338 RepID=A0AB33FEJ2_XANCI|nr:MULTISPECIES: hypothetical protein [Xanthomonas]ARR15295.1 hypothetical protein B7L66_24260 [Xanthomonas citri pv. citri]ARR20037.1 hypothetical protein B7L65_24615 [Xanthomonas citri pv. citri]ARR24680.1 hypothetical protein B7L67_24620 [Xanthomonas citri pv. citri]ATS86803.1 hypothetical protein XcfCFBP6991P_23230 [Xanthomonas citri pv. phaseoli var. fuscans]CEE63460.1 putative type IV secretion system protein IcmG/DotF [Xanthomonas citri pv. citri]
MSTKKQSMSFGKLLGIFGGSMVLLMIVAVIIIKVSSGSPNNEVVTRKPVQAQQQVKEQQPEADIISEMDRRQSLANQENAASAAAQQRQQALAMQVEALSVDLESLRSRITALESGRSSDLVVKPQRRSSQAKARSYPAGSSVLPTYSGYKVQATVSGRAWIESEGGEDSVRVGDTLPPDKRVEAISPDTGVIISPRTR